MSNPAPLTIPTTHGASSFLSGLIGRPTPAKKVKVEWAREKCWLPFCSWSGAALALLPAGLAQDAIKSGKLDQALQDNFAEVANVLTATFREFGERVILGKIQYGSAQLLPEDVRPCVAAPRRLDLEVTITGYGVGRCGLLLA